MANTRENQRRWYAKLKADPVRYAARLAITRNWNTKYRRERSPKYLQMLLRKRARRSLNPFPHRERNRAYYDKLLMTPDAYRTMLERRRAYYMRLKQNQVAYQRYRKKRLVYSRYYRIIQKAREEARVSA